MSMLKKTLSVFTVILVVGVLGAAIQKGGANDVKSKTVSTLDGSLASFGVKVGSNIIVLDSANQAGKETSMIFTVTGVHGWHVKASLPGKMKFRGKNQFVINLEDVSFQIVNSK